MLFIWQQPRPTATHTLKDLVVRIEEPQELSMRIGVVHGRRETMRMKLWCSWRWHGSCHLAGCELIQTEAPRQLHEIAQLFISRVNNGVLFLVQSKIGMPLSEKAFGESGSATN
ncbi:hypothetical protein F442_15195 [Phytophthora nicotianae P10297]|uniref:Uncharacterized protein n=3 Tax=Phytophthora nicotianae TaxID=4792 RepID=W2YRY3_PHYNI|nr:hypothetical protein L915_14913 [Phytophthora nicotianae]ETL32630.1 hypothetical protein L916_14815 [Phytophthora nicotianae]ETL85886.1 hypothetical protein L917_14631 [Phytophthora nicotianae]ETO67749.1 hypothetical protein F444_15357 [Phytophthora nicotianae P1976]ETP36949.1 hypothetical protein F442_15195 [Phytophthora nicotianae P10297]